MNTVYDGPAPKQEILVALEPLKKQSQQLTHVWGTPPVYDIVDAPYVPMQETFDRLNNDFSYHSPSVAAAALNNLTSKGQRYNAIRGLIGALARFLCFVCPSSRELSLAITNLEQAMFWANAAIARHEKEGDESK